jgi:alcohol dehydrogenase
VEAGALDTRPWVTHRATLDGLSEVLPIWMRPQSGVVKAMVEIR